MEILRTFSGRQGEIPGHGRSPEPCERMSETRDVFVKAKNDQAPPGRVAALRENFEAVLAFLRTDPRAIEVFAAAAASGEELTLGRHLGGCLIYDADHGLRVMDDRSHPVIFRPAGPVDVAKVELTVDSLRDDLDAYYRV